MRLHAHARRAVDPTKTTAIRRAFLGEVGRRFRELMAKIRKAIVDDDGFGLLDAGPKVVRLRANRGEFEFTRSADKVEAFMRWLAAAEASGILETTSGTTIASSGSVAWADKYIETAYQRGIADAGRKLRAGGVEVGETWIRNAFNRPIHADRVGLIYTRVYRELKGITDAMDQRISRTLAQGIAEGVGPQVIARAIAEEVQKIGITRARVLARTEIIGAHAEATLNGFEEAGIEGVEVESEFATAGDSKVCPQCERLEGKIFTLSEARGIIPVHPNCRCAWIPVVRNGSGITLNRRRRIA